MLKRLPIDDSIPNQDGGHVPPPFQPKWWNKDDLSRN